MAQHDARREAVVELGLRAEVAQAAAEALQRRHLRAGAPREDRGEADVVDVLVGEHQQLQVLDRVPARGERLFELVERLRGVGPGVDQRERVVLDQVGVDAADREGGGNREAVDPLRRGALQRCLLPLRVWPSRLDSRRAPSPARPSEEFSPRLLWTRMRPAAHERISASTSSRRRSISSWERSDSRQRRSSGSVLEGRTLKCQSS